MDELWNVFRYEGAREDLEGNLHSHFRGMREPLIGNIYLLPYNELGLLWPFIGLYEQARFELNKIPLWLRKLVAKGQRLKSKLRRWFKHE